MASALTVAMTPSRFSTLVRCHTWAFIRAVRYARAPLLSASNEPRTSRLTGTSGLGLKKHLWTKKTIVNGMVNVFVFASPQGRSFNIPDLEFFLLLFISHLNDFLGSCFQMTAIVSCLFITFPDI